MIYGWPKNLNDRAAAHIPFVGDKCASGQGNGLASAYPASTNVASISINTAHFFGGRLQGVNTAFVDGHVEARTPAKMKAVYATGAPSFWFY